MPRVVPSQIVEFIDAEFSFARTRQQYNVDIQFKGSVEALLRLVDELPSELLLLEGATYNRFVHSVSTMKSTLELEIWNSRLSSMAPIFDRKLGDAISDLRACLEPLPDEQIPAAIAGLSFITDVQLRNSIRGDIAFANQAFSGGEWKAATVLAGAAVEALLLWAITDKKATSERESARIRIIPGAPADPNKWDLDGYIKVAREFALIEDETTRQAALAKDFRNLIHLGRSSRLSKICDKGTAHSALAALELVLRDIS